MAKLSDLGGVIAAPESAASTVKVAQNNPLPSASPAPKRQSSVPISQLGSPVPSLSGLGAPVARMPEEAWQEDYEGRGAFGGFGLLNPSQAIQVTYDRLVSAHARAPELQEAAKAALTSRSALAAALEPIGGLDGIAANLRAGKDPMSFAEVFDLANGIGGSYTPGGLESVAPERRGEMLIDVVRRASERTAYAVGYWRDNARTIEEETYRIQTGRELPEANNLRSTVDGFLRGVGDMAGRILSGAGDFVDWVKNPFRYVGEAMIERAGGDTSILNDPGFIEEVGDALTEAAREWFPGDDLQNFNFIVKLAELAGGSLAFMLSGLLSRGVGGPQRFLTIATPGAFAEASIFLDLAEEEQVDAWRRFGAFLAGMGIGSTEAIPVANLFSRLERTLGAGVVARFVQNAPAQATEEGIQEFAQTILEQATEADLLQIQSELDPLEQLAAAGEAGGYGMLLGFLFAGIFSLPRPRGKSPPSPPPGADSEKTPPPPPGVPPGAVPFEEAEEAFDEEGPSPAGPPKKPATPPEEAGIPEGAVPADGVLGEEEGPTVYTEEEWQRRIAAGEEPAPEVEGVNLHPTNNPKVYEATTIGGDGWKILYSGGRWTAFGDQTIGGAKLESASLEELQQMMVALASGQPVVEEAPPAAPVAPPDVAAPQAPPFTPPAAAPIGDYQVQMTTPDGQPIVPPEMAEIPGIEVEAPPLAPVPGLEGVQITPQGQVLPGSAAFGPAGQIPASIQPEGRATPFPAQVPSMPIRQPTVTQPPQPGEGPIPTTEGVRQRPRLPSRPRGRERPLDIIEFLIGIGGIQPDSNLEAMDLRTGFGRAARGGLVREDGRPIDSAREAAAEAGYLGGDIAQALATTTPDDLYGLIGRATAGEEIFSQTAEEQAAAAAWREKRELREYRAQLESQIRSFMEEGGPVDQALLKEAVKRAEERGLGPELTDDEIFDILEEVSIAMGSPAGQEVVEDDIPFPVDEATPAAPAGPPAGGVAPGRGEGVEGGGQRPSPPPPVAGELEGPPTEATEADVVEEGEFDEAPIEYFTPEGPDIYPSEDTTYRRQVEKWLADKKFLADNPAGRASLQEGLDAGEGAFELFKRLKAAHGGRISVVGQPTTEATEAGEQGVIPGTERISEAEQAKRGADKPLRPKADQQPMDEGLFGDESRQTDLVEEAKKPPKQEPEPAKGVRVTKDLAEIEFREEAPPRKGATNYYISTGDKSAMYTLRSYTPATESRPSADNYISNLSRSKAEAIRRAKLAAKEAGRDAVYWGAPETLADYEEGAGTTGGTGAAVERPTEVVDPLTAAGLKVEEKTARNGKTYWAVTGNTAEYKELLDELGAAKPFKMKGVWQRSFYNGDPTEALIDALATGQVTRAEPAAAEPVGAPEGATLPRRQAEIVLRAAKIQVTPDGAGWLVTGKTFDFKETIKDLGGRWDGGKKGWGFKYDPTERLSAEIEKSRSAGGAGRDGEGDAEPSVDADEAARLRELREREDGRTDERIGDPASLVSDETAALIKRGLEFNIPEIVVKEQIEDIGMAVNAFERGKPMFLLANEAGTGKTFVLGGLIRELRNRGEKRLIYITQSQNLIAQIKSDLDAYGVSDVEFATYNKMPQDAEDAILMFDEVHNIKNLEGASRAARGAQLISQAKFTVMASATPFQNPVEAKYLETTGIFGDYGDAHADWAKAYGAAVRRRKFYNPKIGAQQVVETVYWPGRGKAKDGAAAREWFFKQGVMTQRAMRIDPKMVSTVFDPKPVPSEWVKLYDRVNAAYAAVMNDYLDEAGNSRNSTITSEIARHRAGMVKRIMEAAKAPAAIKRAKELLSEGQNVVIFVETKADRWIGKFRRSERFKDKTLYTYPEMQRIYTDWQIAAEIARSRRVPPPPQPFADFIMEVARGFHEANIQEQLPSVADDIIEALGGTDKVALYTGAVTDAAARKNKADFLSGKKKVLVATMAKGGTGLSLHDIVGDRPTTQLNINLPWTGWGVDQVAARVARYGLRSKAHIEWMLAKNIDFEMSVLAPRVGGRMADMGAIVKGIEVKAAKALLGEEGFDLESVTDIKQVAGEGKIDLAAEDVDVYAEAEKLEQHRRKADDTTGGFFETPFPIAAMMTRISGVKEGDNVLEPSAGTGNLLRFMPDGVRITAIEKRTDNFNKLKTNLARHQINARRRDVVNEDFLEWADTAQAGSYDAIVMNPPFERVKGIGAQDSAHVMKAYDLLASDGRLIAIMGEGVFFRGNGQEREFRDWLDAVGATVVKLPEAVFKKSGTGVRARMVIIDRDRPGGRSDIDLADVDAASLREIEAQLPTRGSIDFAQSVWHASPHRFDRFSHDFVRTGEGHMAFGFGTYFAGSKGTGKVYRESIAGSRLVPNEVLREYFAPGNVVPSYGGGADLVIQFDERGAETFNPRISPRPYADWTVTVVGVRPRASGLPPSFGPMKANDPVWVEPESGTEIIVEDGQVVDRKTRKPFDLTHRAVRRHSRSHGTPPEWRDVTAVTGRKPGHLYRVEIPSDDVLMIWEQPFSAQPAKVKAAVEKIYRERGISLASIGVAKSIHPTNNRDDAGQDIYYAISRSYRRTPERPDLDSAMSRGESDELASKALAAEGVLGHRYLDQFSRGTRNPDYINQVARRLANWEGQLEKYPDDATARELVTDLRAELAALQGPKTYNYVIYDDKAPQIVEVEQRIQSSPLSVGSYVRVRVAKGITRYVRITSVDGDTFAGDRVTKSGERWERAVGKERQTEQVMFKRGDVIQRLVMNKKYAELEAEQRQRSDQAPRDRAEAEVTRLLQKTPEELARLENSIRAVIGRMLGRKFKNISVQDVEAFQSASSELGATGIYRHLRDNPSQSMILIAVAANADPLSSAAHEVWHHIEMALLRAGELQVLRRLLPQIKAFAEKHNPQLRGQNLPSWEWTAYAFQAYWKIKEDGGSLSGLHIAARRIFEMVRNLFNEVRRILGKQGFYEVEAIFEKARKGEFADRTAVSNLTEMQVYEQEFQAGFAAARGDGTFDPEFAQSIFRRGGAQARQGMMLGAISRFQPLDQAMRIPFHIFGGIDKDGFFRPNAFVGRHVARIFRKKIPAKGMLAPLSDFLEIARNGLMDRYGITGEMKNIERGARNYGRAIARHGSEILKDLARQNMSLEESRALTAMLRGEVVPNEEWAKISEPIRKAILEYGQASVEYGQLDAETFERNAGVYLHRAYMKHDADQNKLGRWLEGMRSERRKKIIGNQLKGKGLFKEETVDRVPGVKGDKVRMIERLAKPQSELLADNAPEKKRRVIKREYIEPDAPVPDGYMDRGVWEIRSIKGDQVWIWRDWTKEERVKMGEILDARYLIAKLFSMFAEDLSNGKLFKDISENPEFARAERPEGNVVDAAEAGRIFRDMDVEWVRVPTTEIPKTKGAKRYGALAGMWVRAEIWRDLNEADLMSKPGLWRTLMNQWKLNKTARSPNVHMNNVMANFSFMDTHEVHLRDLARAVRSLYLKDEVYQEAEAAGTFGADVISQEIRREALKPLLEEIEKDIKRGYGTPLERGTFLTRLAEGIWSKVKAFDRKMVDLYRAEDEVFRLALFINRRARGVSANDAAIEALDAFLNYDIRAPWINFLRRGPLPFLAFFYRAAPMMARNMWLKPWKLLKWSAMAHVVNALGYMMFPDDDEEEQRRSMRAGLQGWTWIGAPRMIRLPFADATGMPIFLDTRRWIPIADLFDLSQGQWEIPAPFMWGGPLILAAEIFLNRSGFTGEEISDPLDSWTESQIARAAYLWRSWMPGAAWIPGSYYFNRIVGAFKGAEEWDGTPYSIPQAFLSSVGIKVRPQDVQAGFALWSFEFRRREQLIRSEVAAVQRDYARNRISEAQRDARMAGLMYKFETLARDVQYRFTGER